MPQPQWQRPRPVTQAEHARRQVLNAVAFLCALSCNLTPHRVFRCTFRVLSFSGFQYATVESNH